MLAIIFNTKDGITLDLLVVAWNFGKVKLAFVVESNIGGIIEEKPSGDNESPTSGEKSARVSLLEEKVYKLQEEITELLRPSSYYVEHRSYP